MSGAVNHNRGNGKIIIIPTTLEDKCKVFESHLNANIKLMFLGKYITIKVKPLIDNSGMVKVVLSFNPENQIHCIKIAIGVKSKAIETLYGSNMPDIVKQRLIIEGATNQQLYQRLIDLSRVDGDNFMTESRNSGKTDD